MPILKSAKKRMRQNVKSRAVNETYRRSMKESVKEVVAFVEKKDIKGATLGLSKAQKAIDKAVKQGVIKKNKGSRDKSGLAKKVDSLSKK